MFVGCAMSQDYGVIKQAVKKNLDDKDSKLAPALQELIKMLFNVENYRLFEILNRFNFPFSLSFI